GRRTRRSWWRVTWAGPANGSGSCGWRTWTRPRSTCGRSCWSVPRRRGSCGAGTARTSSGPPAVTRRREARGGPPAGETATPGAADGTDAEDRARTDDRAGRRHGTAAHTVPDPPGGGRAASGGGRSAPSPHRRRSEEHTSELQSRENLVCRLLL